MDLLINKYRSWEVLFFVDNQWCYRYQSLSIYIDMPGWMFFK